LAPPLTLPTGSAHFILHYISQITRDEQNRWRSSSLCTFLYSPVTSFLSGPDIQYITLLFKAHSPRSSLKLTHPVFHSQNSSLSELHCHMTHSTVHCTLYTVLVFRAVVSHWDISPSRVVQTRLYSAAWNQCPVLSYSVLYCPVLSYSALYCPIVSCIVI
jgi:hypothetical protein